MDTEPLPTNQRDTWRRASPLLDREEAAAYLHTTPRTLSTLPIPYARVAGKHLYEEADLLAYVRSRRQNEPKPAPPAVPAVPAPVAEAMIRAGQAARTRGHFKAMTGAALMREMLAGRGMSGR